MYVAARGLYIHGTSFTVIEYFISDVFGRYMYMILCMCINSYNNNGSSLNTNMCMCTIIGLFVFILFRWQKMTSAQSA